MSTLARILSRRESLLATLVLIVGGVVLLLHGLTAPIERSGPDGATYERMGWQAAVSDGVFACGNFGRAYWSPGWIAAIAVAYRFAGREPLVIRSFLVLCAVTTAWLCFRTARGLVRSPGALLAPVLFLGSTLVLRYTTYYQYEVALACALSLCAWLMLEPRPPRRGRDVGRGIASGLVFGWAVLASPRVLALFPLAVACLLATRARGNGVLRVAALALGSTLVLAPWAVRNHRCHGEWILTTTNGGINLYVANNPRATGGYYLPPADERPAHRLDDSPAWRREAFSYVRAHPAETVGRALVKAVRFWTPHYGDQVIVLAPFLVGWLRWFRGGRRLSSPLHAWVLAAPLLMTAVHMVFFVQPRYVIPVLPFACVIAAAGIAGWKSAKPS